MDSAFGIRVLILIKFTFCKLQAKFIATCIDEIKLELRQESMDVKANAVIKLVYVSSFDAVFSVEFRTSADFLVFSQLQMLGYDISWACFNMVEVTSSPKFTFKVCEVLQFLSQIASRSVVFTENWLLGRFSSF